MEMNIIKITDTNSTGNKKLDTCINRINSEFSKGIKASHNIARELEKIKNEELFTVTGANSFSDFCENQFGISKSQASRLTQVAEKFLHETVIDENGKTVYTYEAYTTSKLVEMLKATDEQLGLITSDMTVLEIRNLISGKSIEEKTDTNTDTETSYPEEIIESMKTNDKNKKSNKPTNDTSIQALKDRINNAIVSDEVIKDDISGEDAYKSVLKWIDELF